MVAGIVGVVCGGLISAKLKQKFQRADPIICGISLTISAVSQFFAIYLATYSVISSLVVMFIGCTSLNCVWSISDDMLLYVVTPIRRGTAIAVRLVVAHALGGAGGAFMIGLVSKKVLGKNHFKCRLHKTRCHFMFMMLSLITSFR